MRLRNLIAPSALACLLALLLGTPALAVPPLPSSFWGTVKVDGANVPDGTLVQALVTGQAFAETTTKTYQGDSVYSLNVDGDNTDTPAVDGGHEGETVEFEVGGAKAAQAGSWKGGTNQRLDLTAAGRPAGAAPQPEQAAVSPESSQATSAGAPSHGLPGGLIAAIGAVVVAGAGGATYAARRSAKQRKAQ